MILTAFVEICRTFWMDRISVSMGVTSDGVTENQVLT